ncbi:hypothetical protein VB834_28545 [Limnoraphis robusta Tam1]|uniref:hypothetical protein n=1 Tax=Limnoraphis robusta TaxID=1118279 RepID=UPI002B20A02A|nr:hypothetical protein [Limnoraphis robusta]MEA5542986.1 hypothetical protein [Limnoraphis robusta Tam1]
MPLSFLEKAINCIKISYKFAEKIGEELAAGGLRALSINRMLVLAIAVTGI